MLSFRVRRFKDRSGEEVVLLTRRSGEPYFYPNVFVTGDYRNIGRSPNTVAKVLRALGMAFMWGESVGRDLDFDLAEGKFLSYTEAGALACFLGLNASQQEDELASKVSLTKIKGKRVQNLEAFRPKPLNSNEPEEGTVSSEEVGSRIRWVAKYAEWHLERRIQTLQMQGQKVKQFQKSAKSAIERLRALAPTVSAFIDDDVALESPDIEVIESIEQMLRPDAVSNPFTTDFIKHRNYLVWRLLLDTGARRAEVHAAKSDDINYTTRRFKIRKSKGHPRTVALRKKTALAFDDYVMSYWTALPHGSEARKEGYLFCDENGRQLSLRAINRIFEAIRARLEDQPQNLSPHAMRRFWNHLFSTQIDESPPERRLTPQAEARYRMRIMGWTTDNQAARYNRRHIIEAGDRVAQEMMDKMDAGRGTRHRRDELDG